MIEETHVTGSGIRTRALQAGSLEAEEAVVFLHGVPGSADVWRPLMSAVAEFGRAVALDLPGFGQADQPADWSYSPAAHAEFLAGVLDELGIERAWLVMHDLGGVGLPWAVAHPAKFAGAVIMDTGVLVGYRWHAVARIFRTPVLGRLAERAGRIGFRQVMAFYGRRPRPLPHGTVDRWVAGYDRGARRALLRFYRATPAAAYEILVPALRELDRPALVVWGAHDRFLPTVQAERQRLSFPSAEVVVLPESGHYPHLDDPEGVAAVVIPFLRRTRNGRPD
jgi:pimeloyl-ACP methyl ester carboxylesterase